LVNNAGIYEYLPKTSPKSTSTNSSISMCWINLTSTRNKVLWFGGRQHYQRPIASTAAPATGSVYNATKASMP